MGHNAPLEIVNLTLVGFFVSYCVCLLVYGPLEDMADPGLWRKTVDSRLFVF